MSIDYQRHFANIMGYFLLARHSRDLAVEHAHSASIDMVCSMYCVVGSYPSANKELIRPSPAAYHALKSSIVQLMRHLAVYWAKDSVRVNV